MSRPIPTPRQLRFMDWEFGAMFHFGIRSFFLGHTDWDERPMPAQAFDPESLDCDQWLDAVSEAGARYAILVCKHHDGFANWPSKYTDYSVASSPWRGGQGDVVREFVDACRRHDMGVGLYYSPAQWGGDVAYQQNKDYDDYFIGQISELLTGYGKIDYLWFDGCGSEGHEYDKERIVRAIRSMQPDILIFNMWDPDTRWIGNEDGYAPMPNPMFVSAVDFSEKTEEKEKLGRQLFLPAECDFKLRSTWFDCELNEDTIKTPDELLGIYESSVGHGANFLMNIGPNRHGLINDSDLDAVRAFGARLRARYGEPIKAFGPLRQTEETQWTASIDGFDSVRGGAAASPVLVNRVALMEDMTRGGAVRRYELYANLPTYAGQKLLLYSGTTIGHKAICTFPTVRTACLTLRVIEAEGGVSMRGLDAYYSE